MKKYISTGGAGDAWICYLKIRALKNKDEAVDWLHVESTAEVKAAMDYIKNKFESGILLYNNVFNFEHDPDYIENYKKGKWSDRIPISSGIDSWCPLKGETEIKLEVPFIHDDLERNIELKYDYCIQVSGGAKNNRGWRFDPRYLKKILDSYGKRVILVGTDRRFYDEKDENNLVGKTSNIGDAFALIGKSNTFIGLSGFLNYWCSSMKINNIFLEESPEHTKRYFHPDWMEYAQSVKYGSLGEVLKLIHDKGPADG